MPDRQTTEIHSLEKPSHIELQFGGSSAGGRTWRHQLLLGGNQIVNTPSAKVALQDLRQQVPEEHTRGFACVCVCATPPKHWNTRGVSISLTLRAISHALS